MMLQSFNLVSDDGAGHGQEEHFLPHLGDTACGDAPVYWKLAVRRTETLQK